MRVEIPHKLGEYGEGEGGVPHEGEGVRTRDRLLAILYCHRTSVSLPALAFFLWVLVLKNGLVPQLTKISSVG